MSKKWGKPGRTRHAIAASAPAAGPFRLVGASEGLELLAEAAPDGTDQGRKLRRFSITAYTGAAMRLPWYPAPVVVDLEGMAVPNQAVPIYRDHDHGRIVGHSQEIAVSQQRLKLSGLMSGVGPDADEVRALATNGFPWQASMGADVDRMEFVEAGQKVTVNGRSFQGPVYVARQTVLGEVSFVGRGADTGTTAVVAAGPRGDIAMNFEAWLAARGIDPATLTEARKAELLAQFQAGQAASPATPPAPAPVPPPVQAPAPPVVAQAPTPDPVADMRKRIVAEMERVAAVQEAARDHPDIAARAVKEGWTVERTELQVLRDTRPNPAIIVGGSAPLTGEVIECALWQTLGLSGAEKRFKEPALEAAHKHYRNLGLQQTLLLAAAANGYHAGPAPRIHNGNLREVLAFAFPRDIRAASSTYSLSGTLGNVANKELLQGWEEGDQAWREIAGIRSVGDFKAVTSYRLLDDSRYEELGPNGEIKHGTLSEESYTRQAATYAKMFALTRTDIINDDLGAFDTVRSRLGNGAIQKFNDVFWGEFVNNSAFFTAGRANYITGATTTLLTDGVGIGLGLKAFRTMKSPSPGNKRIGGLPSILLVPPELEYAADQLFQGQKLTTSSGDGPTNVYANKYRPVVAAQLSDSNFTGYSATAWYLLRNPAVYPTIVSSFLNGNQAPTVESAEADFNTLGIEFRGYHDFGCDLAEYLGGVKSKGAA